MIEASELPRIECRRQTGDSPPSENFITLRYMRVGCNETNFTRVQPELCEIILILMRRTHKFVLPVDKIFIPR